MDSAPRPSLPSSRLDRVLTGLLLVGALVYSIFLYQHGSPYAGGSDSSGYLNSARLLGEGHLFAPIRKLADQTHVAFGPDAFGPLGFFVDRQQPRMAPTYPIGLPVHLLIAGKIAGWDRAALGVNIFAALAGGALLWLLGRYFSVPPAWCSVAVGWLWLCPQFIFCALQPMSDALALAWSLAVLYTAFRARAAAPWAFACGAAIAIAVLVRPTNALIIFPAFLIVGLRPRALVCLVLGGIPGALALAYYNDHVYGAIFSSGYHGLAEEFDQEFVPHNAAHMLYWIPRVLSPLVCAALGWCFLRRHWSRDGLILTGWVALLAGFYSFYFHTGELWWYLRFILPVYPLLILGAVSVLQKIPASSTLAQAALLGGAMVIVGTSEMHFNRELHPTSIKAEEQSYRQLAAWARAKLPPQSAIVCMQVSGAFYFYTDFLLIRWDRIDPRHAANLLATLRTQHHPVYAVLYDFEDVEARGKIDGAWKKIETVGPATIWQKED